ncbi:MAG TPA: FtsX-like permease family protein [Burkholderiales bacterium]|nr:FtsX-like permease family protein [Burkholderiales bacterium]
MNLLTLSLRMLARDWRSGELRVLAAAMVIAVGSVTAVAFFIDRVGQALDQEANQLLGADLVLASDRSWREEFADEARRRGLQVTRVLKFPSMVQNAESGQLTEIKAVAEGYPLRGELRIATETDKPGSTVNAAPKPETVWADQRLLVRLGLKLGDSVELGAARFKVAAVVTEEPDYAVGFFNIAPRLIMNQDDVSATGLVQTGSRVNYYWLFAGEPERISAFRQWSEPRLASGERLQDVKDARPEIRAALERAQKYLGLAALMSVVLAAAAIALAARRFVERHLDGCAMLRCLGSSQGSMLRLYFYHFLVLGLAASLAGCLLGLIAQQLLAHWLGVLVAKNLPPPGPLPLLQGLVSGLVLLLGFALPPLIRLSQVPALRVMRRELDLSKGSGGAGHVLGLMLIAGLLLWQSNELKLGLYVLGGLVLGAVVSALAGFGLIKALAFIPQGVGVTWRYGLASARRHSTASVVQVVCLSAGMTALLLLTLVRGDLLQSWRASLPADAPNRFLVNIQPDQLPSLKEFFASHRFDVPRFFPMVRGRLTAINNQRVSSSDYPDERAKRLIEREFNLSWAARMQEDNQIVEGAWWAEKEHSQSQFSVEQGLAETLGIRLDDTLAYDIAGATIRGRVTSLRKVDWDSFRVNFFVIAPPGVLESYPVSYITSFHLPPQRAPIINDLVKAFPNFLVIDVEAILAQVQKIMDQVVQAVEFVFLFGLFAGLMVLYAAIVATQDERLLEAGMLRTLGASRGQVLRAQLAEFAAIGALAGLLAAAASSALGLVLAEKILNIPYAFNPWLWLLGVVGGGAGVPLASWPQLRAILLRPPLQTLRGFG